MEYIVRPTRIYRILLPLAGGICCLLFWGLFYHCLVAGRIPLAILCLLAAIVIPPCIYTATRLKLTVMGNGRFVLFNGFTSKEYAFSDLWYQERFVEHRSFYTGVKDLGHDEPLFVLRLQNGHLLLVLTIAYENCDRLARDLVLFHHSQRETFK